MAVTEEIGKRASIPTKGMKKSFDVVSSPSSTLINDLPIYFDDSDVNLSMYEETGVNTLEQKGISGRIHFHMNFMVVIVLYPYLLSPKEQSTKTNVEQILILTNGNKIKTTYTFDGRMYKFINTCAFDSVAQVNTQNV